MSLPVKTEVTGPLVRNISRYSPLMSAPTSEAVRAIPEGVFLFASRRPPTPAMRSPMPNNTAATVPRRTVTETTLYGVPGPMALV